MEHALDDSGCGPINLSEDNLSLVNVTNMDAVYTIKFENLDSSITNTELRGNFFQVRVVVETIEAPSKTIELTTVVRM